MNCYVCLVETGCSSHPAFAICQQCGAGMCDEHLVTVTMAPLSGMIGEISTRPRRSLLCSFCSGKRYPAPQPRMPEHQSIAQRRRGMVSLSHWWRWLWRRRWDDLPDAEDVVIIAEQWLKGQRGRE